MNKTEAIALILKQLNGVVTPDEEQALNIWLSQNPEHEAVRGRIIMLHGANWHLLPVSPPPGFFSRQREILLQRAAESETHRRSIQTRIRIAAVIVLTMLASVFIYFTRQDALNTENTFSFTNTELRLIAQALEDEYNISIQVENSKTGTLRFTGQFVNRDVTDVLTTLSKSLPITVERHQHVYVLKARN